MPKKTCRGVFYKDRDKMTEEEVKKDIICVPNKVGTPMFYKLDYKTGNFKFIGYENLIKECFNNLEDYKISPPDCKYTSTYSINPDHHLIKIYLASLNNEHFSNTTIKNRIMSELEELKKKEPDNDFFKDSEYIEKITIFFEKNKAKIKIAPHIIDFINDLVQYTDITLHKLDEIFKGAYTILRGDKGIIYQKFLYESEKQLTKAYESGIDHEYARNPLVYAYAEYYLETDQNKIKTKLENNRYYEKSSHPSNDYNQLRMGAGSIINCLGETCINNKFEILMGTSVEEGTIGDTWFQFENSRMDDIINWWSHAFDATRYFASAKYGSGPKKNLGPFGWSIHNDTNPQYLSICNADDIKDRQSGELEECIHKAL
jgi:hypothetical protein